MANSTTFKEGMTPWNKGRNISGMSGKKQSSKHIAMLKARKGTKMSPESKEKMRLAKLGKPGSNLGKTWKVSPEKLKNFGKNAGEAHWNWKGGITDSDRAERLRFRRKLQHKILERDDYTCQVCDYRGNTLQIDHIKGWAKYPELRFIESNCRTLCMACHYYVTFKRKIPKGVVWGHNLSRRIAS